MCFRCKGSCWHPEADSYTAGITVDASDEDDRRGGVPVSLPPHWLPRAQARNPVCSAFSLFSSSVSGKVLWSCPITRVCCVGQPAGRQWRGQWSGCAGQTDSTHVCAAGWSLAGTGSPAHANCWDWTHCPPPHLWSLCSREVHACQSCRIQTSSSAQLLWTWGLKTVITNDGLLPAMEDFTYKLQTIDFRFKVIIL